MPSPDRDKSVEQWLRQTPIAGASVEDCLDAETLAAWSEGLLDGRERSMAEAHAASCARCQAMLAVMVRTTPAPAGSAGSPFRKWLMILSPAMAAAAAVALWVAVDRRPAPSAIDELSKQQAKAERPAAIAQPAPTSAVGTDKEEPFAPRLTADGRREIDDRTSARTQPDAGTPAAAENERREKKDLASAKRADKPQDAAPLRAAAEPAAPPPSAAPAPSRPASESVRVSASSSPVQVAPPGPAPLQQANQAQNQNQALNQNQAQTPNQNQAGQRQQAAGALEERVVAPAEKPLARAAGDTTAEGRSAGRGGAAGGFADASALKFRANASPFDIAVPESSIRWRVVDGRTILRSGDEGVTWVSHHTAENGVTLTAGAAPAPNICWLVGRSGAIILTTDGRAWRRITFSEAADLAAVTASDARSAAVTTADGRQFATTDGGRTWTRR